MLIYRESLSFLFLAHVGLLAHLAHTLYMYNPSQWNVVGSISSFFSNMVTEPRLLHAAAALLAPPAGERGALP